MQIQPKLQADHAAWDIGSGSATVSILRSVEEIESIREFWFSSAGTLDSDVDVFLPLHAGIPEGLPFRVLVVYRGGNPVALMAGRIDRKRFAFQLGWFDLFTPLVNVLTIRGGLRGDASLENCQEVVRMIIQCLKNGEADIALLTHVEAGSSLFRSVKSEPGFLFRDYFTPLRPHRKRELPGSIEQLYADLSGHERKRFRQIAKKLSNEFSGQIRVDRFETLTDLEPALTVVEEIAKKTWQGKMGSGLNIEAFKKQAKRGLLRIYILYLADRPSAFSIGALYRGTFFSEYIGFDTDYASYSLGTYLLSRMLEDLCLGGVEAIDFGSSDEAYKKRFGNVTWRETDLYLFAPSLKGLRLSAMKAITVLLRESTRAFLERTNLVQRVKKVWRKLSSRRAKTNEVRA